MKRNATRSGLQVMVAAVLLNATAGLAQSWPSRPVTLVVPFAAGGPTDLVARALAPALEATYKLPFIIDNRVGAGGLVGTGEVARSKPDGYTLLFQSNGVTLAPLFQKSIPYDPADLRPIVGVSSSYYVVTTNTSMPRTLKEFVAYAKARPKQLNVATIPYTPLDLDIQGLIPRLGLDLTPINYNGTATLLPSLVRGDTHMTVGGTLTVLQLIRSGKITALAYTGPTRSSLLPDVPTLKEQGVDLVAGYTLGVWVPSKIPQDLVDRITAGVVATAQSPAMLKLMSELALEQPDHRRFEQQIRNEQKAFSEIAQRIGLKPQ